MIRNGKVYRRLRLSVAIKSTGNYEQAWTSNMEWSGLNELSLNSAQKTLQQSIKFSILKTVRILNHKPKINDSLDYLLCRLCLTLSQVFLLRCNEITILLSPENHDSRFMKALRKQTYAGTPTTQFSLAIFPLLLRFYKRWFTERKSRMTRITFIICKDVWRTRKSCRGTCCFGFGHSKVNFRNIFNCEVIRM